MLVKGITKRQAVDEWVSRFHMFPRSMIQKLMDVDIVSWHEVTKPTKGTRVYIYDMPEKDEGYDYNGVVEAYLKKTDRYRILLNDGNRVKLKEEEFEISLDYWLPMWGYLWQFGDSADDYWLDNLDGVRIMSECGFRVYEHEEWGYFFGIDGCGYSFYEAHWLPLYERRGLKWHDIEAETDVV